MRRIILCPLFLIAFLWLLSINNLQIEAMNDGDRNEEGTLDAAINQYMNRSSKKGKAPAEGSQMHQLEITGMANPHNEYIEMPKEAQEEAAAIVSYSFDEVFQQYEDEENAKKKQKMELEGPSDMNAIHGFMIANLWPTGSWPKEQKFDDAPAKQKPFYPSAAGEFPLQERTVAVTIKKCEYGNYHYNKDKPNKGQASYWKCQKTATCNGRAVIYEKKHLRITGMHTCRFNEETVWSRNMATACHGYVFDMQKCTRNKNTFFFEVSKTYADRILFNIPMENLNGTNTLDILKLCSQIPRDLNNVTACLVDQETFRIGSYYLSNIFCTLLGIN